MLILYFLIAASCYIPSCWASDVTTRQYLKDKAPNLVTTIQRNIDNVDPNNSTFNHHKHAVGMPLLLQLYQKHDDTAGLCQLIDGATDNQVGSLTMIFNYQTPMTLPSLSATKEQKQSQAYLAYQQGH